MLNVVGIARQGIPAGVSDLINCWLSFFLSVASHKQNHQTENYPDGENVFISLYTSEIIQYRFRCRFDSVRRQSILL